MKNADIDELILAKCNDRWQKVARIVVRVADDLSSSEHSWQLRTIGRRVRTLANKGSLRAAGNLYNSRRSEVELPDRESANSSP